MQEATCFLLLNNQCMLETYTPLRCSMRECHYLRKWRQTCPVPCRVYTKCGDCVAVTGCGWCSKQGANGEGFCMEGGITGPTLGATCTTGNITLLIPELLNFGGKKILPPIPPYHLAGCKKILLPIPPHHLAGGKKILLPVPPPLSWW